MFYRQAEKEWTKGELKRYILSLKGSAKKQTPNPSLLFIYPAHLCGVFGIIYTKGGAILINLKEKLVVLLPKFSELVNFDWYDPEYMGTIADWVSGIGTLIAVMVTLYFSTRDNRKRLRITSSWSYAIFQNGNMSSDGLITVDAVNIGKIPIHIHSVGLIKRKRTILFSGIFEKIFSKSFRRMQFLQFFEVSDNLPTVIAAQEAKTFRNTATSQQLRNDKNVSKKMRAYVQDSTGKLYYSKKIKI